MQGIFEQGESAFISCVFVDGKGAAASITGTPTITIKHYNGSSVETDVNGASMTQVSGSHYYYLFSVPSNADLANYSIMFSAAYADGTTVIFNDTFKVVSFKFYNRVWSGGAYVKEAGLSEEDRKLLKEIFELAKELKKFRVLPKVLDKMQSELNEVKIKLKSQDYENMTDEEIAEVLRG